MVQQLIVRLLQLALLVVETDHLLVEFAWYFVVADFFVALCCVSNGNEVGVFVWEGDKIC